MTTETKTVQTEGPALADVLKEHEAAGWRCTSIDCLGAADYSLHLARVVEQQKELLP